MALAKKWKKMPVSPYVIFATAYDQYALDAFSAEAVDYVLKPFEQSRINEALDRIKNYWIGSNAIPPITSKNILIRDCQLLMKNERS